MPVILVNCRLEAKHTSTQELFPQPLVTAVPVMSSSSPTRSRSPNPMMRKSASHVRASRGGGRGGDEGDFDEATDSDKDLSTWSIERVQEWLVNNDFSSLVDSFRHHKIGNDVYIYIICYY